ncbi:MAG TPA: hypothetical protein PLV39_14720 [Fimbriimonadaceae bacterium]|nr:hypothetical protein [Fimbriimonadaceae bacterium]
MKPLTLTNLQADGACADGLAWIAPLLEAGGPSEADWGRRPFYWDWALYRGYDVPVTAELARRNPWSAFKFALDHLDDELVAELARLDPWAAFVFAKKRLSDELVAELARLDPWAAFEYALDRLDDDDARVVEVAVAMAEACLRLALARIQQGEFKGHAVPDPTAKWRARWDSLGGGEIGLSIESAQPVERGTLHAVTARLYALGFPSALCIVRGKGHEWLIALEVSEVEP